MFNINIIRDEIPRNISILRINKRIAVRGIVHFENKILMVQTIRGDYKFPGGGVCPGENNKSALLREIREETVYINIEIGDIAGTVFEQNTDTFDSGAYFQMTSYYYNCRLVNLERIEKNLDNYEEKLCFDGVLICPQSALNTNQKLLNSDIDWIERETIVLGKIT